MPHCWIFTYVSSFSLHRTSPFYNGKGAPKYYAFSYTKDVDGSLRLERKYECKTRDGEPSIRTRKIRHKPANLG